MSVLGRVGSFVHRVGGFFDVPEVARYVTLSPRTFTIPDESSGLPVSDRHFQDVTAPGLVPGSLPVLFFRTSNGGRSGFSIRVNAVRVIQDTLSGTEPSPLSWHVLVPPGALAPEGNELTFAVPAGGSVLFSDVVILYRSNQLTVKKSILEPPIATQ
jgi:hypothetical protein